MLDHLLAFLLLLLIPVRAVWRSRSKKKTAKTKTARYLSIIGMVAGLLTLLATSWLLTGRSADALGLGVPTSPPSLIGLGLAVTLLAGLRLSKGRTSAPLRPDVEAARRETFPETTDEERLFLIVSVVVGGGWEILYRGFLLSYLQPTTGLWGAVVIAAFAYGAAHGSKTARQFAGSVASALAFTIGYAVTLNLWWLMLLHTSLMLLGAQASKAASRDMKIAHVARGPSDQEQRS